MGVVMAKVYTVENRTPENGKYFVVWTDNDAVGWVQATYISDAEEMGEYDLDEPSWIERDSCVVSGVTGYSII
jgi:hypothetical protein